MENSGIINSIVRLLPTSPFAEFIDRFASLPYLGWLNWFFPVGECLTVMAAWLVAYGLFLLYSVIMRTVRLID